MVEAARAAPDGYTMILVSSSFTVNPSLYKHCPYDPFKDLVPVTLAAITPNILVVNPSVPAKTPKELIDLIKKGASKFTDASPGIGTTPHLAAELFKSTYKLDYVIAPYNGGGPAVAGGAGQRYAVLLRRADADDAAREDRQAARAGGHHREAVEGVAGCADHRGSRHQRPGIRNHPGRADAEGHAAGDRRHAAEGNRGHRRGARHAGEDDPARFRADGDTAAEFAAYIKTDVAKWKKVIEDAHIKQIE